MKSLTPQKIGARDLAGILSRIGVEVLHAQPYNGQSKPIERAFQGFAQTFAIAQVRS